MLRRALHGGLGAFLHEKRPPAAPGAELNLEKPRRRISAAVAYRPGLSKSALARHLNMPLGTLSHHLQCLLDAKLVSKVETAKETFWGPAGMAPEAIRRHAVLSRPVGQIVRHYLTGVPQCALVDLVRQTGLSRSTLRKE